MQHTINQHANNTEPFETAIHVRHGIAQSKQHTRHNKAHSTTRKAHNHHTTHMWGTPACIQSAMQHTMNQHTNVFDTVAHVRHSITQSTQHPRHNRAHPATSKAHSHPHVEQRNKLKQYLTIAGTLACGASILATLEQLGPVASTASAATYLVAAFASQCDPQRRVGAAG